MSCTYGEIEKQVHNLLANVKGPDVATVETNYLTISTNTNRNNPGFSYSPVQDAIVSTITELVAVICDTPQHPERRDFVSTSAPLASGDLLPNVDNLANKVIGGFGAVLDAASDTPLEPASLDAINGRNKFAATIYNGIDFYWYAFDGQRIRHTRPNVVIDVQTYEKQAFGYIGPIPLRDHHEKAIVNGAIGFLGPKESAYALMVEQAKKDYAAWIAEIRTFAKFPVAQIDPALT